jgi:hypothetical protein
MKYINDIIEQHLLVLLYNLVKLWKTKWPDIIQGYSLDVSKTDGCGFVLRVPSKALEALGSWLLGAWLLGAWLLGSWLPTKSGGFYSDALIKITSMNSKSLAFASAESFTI